LPLKKNDKKERKREKKRRKKERKSEERTKKEKDKKKRKGMGGVNAYMPMLIYIFLYQQKNGR